MTDHDRKAEHGYDAFAKQHTARARALTREQEARDDLAMLNLEAQADWDRADAATEAALVNGQELPSEEAVFLRDTGRNPSCPEELASYFHPTEDYDASDWPE